MISIKRLQCSHPVFICYAVLQAGLLLGVSCDRGSADTDRATAVLNPSLPNSKDLDERLAACSARFVEIDNHADRMREMAKRVTVWNALYWTAASEQTIQLVLDTGKVDLDDLKALLRSASFRQIAFRGMALRVEWRDHFVQTRDWILWICADAVMRARGGDASESADGILFAIQLLVVLNDADRAGVVDVAMLASHVLDTAKVVYRQCPRAFIFLRGTAQGSIGQLTNKCKSFIRANMGSASDLIGGGDDDDRVIGEGALSCADVVCQTMAFLSTGIEVAAYHYESGAWPSNLDSVVCATCGPEVFARVSLRPSPDGTGGGGGVQLVSSMARRQQGVQDYSDLEWRIE